MATRYDFKKEWPKVKKQLMQFSQEALDLAKKGEKELVKVSKKGKLHLDSTALSLKKEHLYHLIGKAYIEANCPGPQTPKLKKLIEDVTRLDRDIIALKKRLKPGTIRKRSRATARKSG